MAGSVKPTNTNVLKAIFNSPNFNYNGRIPEVTENNIADVYKNILDYKALRNAVCDALYDVIGQQIIHGAFFQNPLNVLKELPMRYGSTEEEIFVNFVKGYEYNPYASYTDLFAYYEGNVMAAYHKINRNQQYASTIRFDDLRTAFLQEYGIINLMQAKMSALISSEQFDEYLCMLGLLKSAYDARLLYPYTVAPITNYDTAEDVVIKLKTAISRMMFPHPEYNIAGADSTGSPDSIYYMVDAETDAILDVKVLAYLFNNDYAKAQAHKIVIDSFPNAEIKAFVFDMRWFKVKEQYKVLSDSKNGASLSWNNFYSVKEMLSYSPFFPAVVLTTESVSVTSVTITDVEVAKGSEVNLTATVAGVGYIPWNLRWDVTGGMSKKTGIIPGTSTLMIGDDETATELEVTATSIYDNTISGNGTVTIK